MSFSTLNQLDLSHQSREETMTTGLTITDVERIVVDVPYTPRCQEWNRRGMTSAAIPMPVSITPKRISL